MSDAWTAKPVTSNVTPLGRFVSRLTVDADLHQQFLENPELVVAETELSAEETEALHHGTWQDLVVLLGPRPMPLPKERPSGGGS